MLNRTTKASLLTSGEQSNALLPKVAPAQARDRGLHVLEMPLQGAIPLGPAPVAEGLTADSQPVADLRRRDPGPLARAAESCQASSSLRSCKPQAAVGFANRGQWSGWRGVICPGRGGAWKAKELDQTYCDLA